MASNMSAGRRCRNAVTHFCQEVGAEAASVCGYARRTGGRCDLESVVGAGMGFREAASLLGTMLGQYAEAHEWDTQQMLGFLFAVAAERDTILKGNAAENEL